MSEINIIDSSDKRFFPEWKEIWKYRHLLLSLAWRDIKVKYAQTFVGLIWVFINPVINLVLLCFIFNVVLNAETDGIPPLLFAISGICAWTYFAVLTSEAGSSLIGAQNMISKIYFPRLIIPLSKAISGLVDFAVSLFCLFLLLIYYGKMPAPNIVFLPFFIFHSLVLGTATGILIASLNIRYRDFNFIVPLILRIGIFVTPIAYTTSMVPENYKFVFLFNPMVGIIEGYRWSLFDIPMSSNSLIFSAVETVILLFLSLFIFNRIDKNIADLI